jgi:GDPmannose 4,6-dehydratase
MGMKLRWQGADVDETATVVDPGPYGDASRGKVIVRVDPRYFRPTEVETLLGDASKAHEKLGWKPTTSFEQLVSEMVRTDLEANRKYALIKQNGFAAYAHSE